MTDSKSDTEDSHGEGVRTARLAMTALPLVMAAALLATVYTTYGHVIDASATVARGQGEGLLQGIGRLHEDDLAQLDELVGDGVETGLLCIAVFDHELSHKATSGSCSLSTDELERHIRDTEQDQAVKVGDNILMIDHKPPGGDRVGRRGDRADRGGDRDGRRGVGRRPPPERGPPPPPPRDGRLGDPQRRPPPGERRPRDNRPRDDDRRLDDRRSNPANDRPPPRRRAPLPLLIEFTPLSADALEGAATRTAAIGGIAALALILAAAILHRLSIRAERRKAEAERERHLASLGEMSAVMAHEIRNPLASMKGHAQLLAEKLAPGSRERQNADRVVSEAVRLERLTSDLLSLVRSQQVEPRPIDPRALLRGSAAAVSDSRITMTFDGAPDRWQLDGPRLQQVLVNLMRNALQASPDGQPVEAAVTVKSEQLVFTVRDHGAGVPPGERKRIFEPFHTTRTRGTGLGLAVSKRIATMHGGTLSVHDHPEGGAVFRLAIPRG